MQISLIEFFFDIDVTVTGKALDNSFVLLNTNQPDFNLLFILYTHFGNIV